MKIVAARHASSPAHKAHGNSDRGYAEHPNATSAFTSPHSAEFDDAKGAEALRREFVACCQRLANIVQ
jgi:hypothetical protein